MTPIERRPFRQSRDIHRANLKRVWVPPHPVLDEGIAGQVPVRPQHQARSTLDVLCREEGLEEPLLPWPKRRKIRAPIRVVCELFQRWRTHDRPYRTREIVAVPIHPEREARLELRVPCAVEALGDVVGSADARGRKAPRERLDGGDLLPHPRAPIKRELDMWLPGEETDEENKERQWQCEPDQAREPAATSADTAAPA
jgi:hypothetical protein